MDERARFAKRETFADGGSARAPRGAGTAHASLRQFLRDRPGRTAGRVGAAQLTEPPGATNIRALLFPHRRAPETPEPPTVGATAQFDKHYASAALGLLPLRSQEEMTDDIRQEACVLALAITCGVVDRQAVISWADKIIDAAEKPDYEIIELVTMERAHIQDLVGKLQGIGSPCNQFTAVRVVLGRMYQLASSPEIKLRVFARGLEQFSASHSFDLPSDLSFIGSLDDGLYLAEEGVHGDLSAFRNEFMDRMREYWSERSAAPNWYSASLHTIG